MRIDVNITNLDMAKAILYVHVRNKFIWGLCIFGGVLSHVNDFQVLRALNFPTVYTAFLLFTFLIYVFTFCGIGYLCTVIGLLFNPKWRRGRIGHHTLTINDSGIIEATKYNNTELKWEAISNLVPTKTLLYMPHSGGEIFVIPRRDFPSYENWNHFITNLKKHWRTSKSGKITSA